MRRLYIIRGLPGSGKSTLAQILLNGDTRAWLEADAFFMKEEEYLFDPSKLKAAHSYCRQAVENAMIAGFSTVVVSNTFSTEWEFFPYVGLAAEYGYHVVFIDLFDSGLTDEELAKCNIHKCPIETITKMRARWEK